MTILSKIITRAIVKPALRGKVTPLPPRGSQRTQMEALGFNKAPEDIPEDMPIVAPDTTRVEVPEEGMSAAKVVGQQKRMNLIYGIEPSPVQKVDEAIEAAPPITPIETPQIRAEIDEVLPVRTEMDELVHSEIKYTRVEKGIIKDTIDSPLFHTSRSAVDTFDPDKLKEFAVKGNTAQGTALYTTPSMLNSRDLYYNRAIPKDTQNKYIQKGETEKVVNAETLHRQGKLSKEEVDDLIFDAHTYKIELEESFRPFILHSRNNRINSTKKLTSLDKADFLERNPQYTKGMPIFKHKGKWKSQQELEQAGFEGVIDAKDKFKFLDLEGTSKHEVAIWPSALRKVKHTLVRGIGAKEVKPKKGKTREEVELQGGPLSSKLNEQKIGRLLDEHNIKWEYNDNGGITAIEEFSKGPSRKKYFKRNTSLKTIRDWLGYAEGGVVDMRDGGGVGAVGEAAALMASGGQASHPWESFGWKSKEHYMSTAKKDYGDFKNWSVFAKKMGIVPPTAYVPPFQESRAFNPLLMSGERIYKGKRVQQDIPYKTSESRMTKAELAEFQNKGTYKLWQKRLAKQAKSSFKMTKDLVHGAPSKRGDFGYVGTQEKFSGISGDTPTEQRTIIGFKGEGSDPSIPTFGKEARSKIMSGPEYMNRRGITGEHINLNKALQEKPDPFAGELLRVGEESWRTKQERRDFIKQMEAQDLSTPAETVTYAGKRGGVVDMRNGGRVRMASGGASLMSNGGQAKAYPVVDMRDGGKMEAAAGVAASLMARGDQVIDMVGGGVIEAGFPNFNDAVTMLFKDVVLKNIFGFPVPKIQTEKNLNPSTIEVLRNLARIAKKAGRSNITHADYGKDKQGAPISGIIGGKGEKEASKIYPRTIMGFLKLTKGVLTDPKLETAMTFAGASLHVDEKGNTILTDDYNAEDFIYGSSSKGTYGPIRNAVGKWVTLEEEGGRAKKGTIKWKVNLGKIN